MTPRDALTRDLQTRRQGDLSELVAFLSMMHDLTPAEAEEIVCDWQAGLIVGRDAA